MNEIKLKPCPFCESENQIFFRTQKGRFYIRCGCGFCGECYNTLDDAKAAWNRRIKDETD